VTLNVCRDITYTFGRFTNKYSTALATEWSRARARTHRWVENLELLCEEALRTLRYGEYEQARWLKIARTARGRTVGDRFLWGSIANDATTSEDPQLAAGRRAFATERADVERRLLIKFSNLLRPALASVLETGLVPAFDLPEVMCTYCHMHHVS
jgi:hypothetical protein